MTTLVRFFLVWGREVCSQLDTVATLNPTTMETLQLFRGDTIIVRYVVVHGPDNSWFSLTAFVVGRRGVTLSSSFLVPMTSKRARSK